MYIISLSYVYAPKEGLIVLAVIIIVNKFKSKALLMNLNEKLPSGLNSLTIFITIRIIRTFFIICMKIGVRMTISNFTQLKIYD